MRNSKISAECRLDFAHRIEEIIHLPAAEFLVHLSAALSNAGTLLSQLSEDEQLGNEKSYARSVLYADPKGRFTVLALTWRSGQFTPIHGHWTWCGYTVLRGEIEEEHFAWNAAVGAAEFKQRFTRLPGSRAVSPPGLDDIHRLGNYASETAISLHVYGVTADLVTARVNRVVNGQFDLSRLIF